MAQETKAKYHHLIPQTYFSPWEHGQGTLYIEFLNNQGHIVERNKENIAGINNYHSIKAGMPICTKEDAIKLFKPVENFNIEYMGKTVKEPLRLNEIYYDFDNWIITRTDGTSVKKSRIKDAIDKIKIKDIEINWSTKYENFWGNQVEVIKENVLNATTEFIDEFDREYIMCFFTALDWRGFRSNSEFEAAQKHVMALFGLDEIDVPKGERLLPSIMSIAEEMRHCLLLKYYRQYLNDCGIIYRKAMLDLEKTTFSFLVSNGKEKFITSDSPAFTFQHDGKLQGVFPITPEILLVQTAKDNSMGNKYYITNINDQNVCFYNEVIKENAQEFLVKY